MAIIKPGVDGPSRIGEERLRREEVMRAVSQPDCRLLLRRNHAAFPRVIEQAADVHDRADVAERFEFISLAAVHG